MGRFLNDSENWYHVEVYDAERNKVDERFHVIAWSRREAYFGVMNELKPHATWDATMERHNTIKE